MATSPPASPAPGAAPEPAGAPAVTDNGTQSQFEVRVGGELAGLVKYHRSGDVLSLIHTEVNDKFQGMGLAGALARAALDSARERGLSVLPYCPYIASWVRKHPDYGDLVPLERHEEFGL